MKIGVHEFETEGPRELVIAQIDTWMRAAGLAATRAAAGDTPATPAAADASGETDPALRTLFHVDTDRQPITSAPA